LSKADSNRLNICERKIHGAVNYKGRWRIRSNNVIEQISENKNILKFIVRQGQVVRLCGKNG